MRLADADLLPFNFGDLSSAVAAYVGDIQRLAGRESAAIRERNREIAEGVYALSIGLRPAPPGGAKAEADPPQLDFAPLLAARDQLARAAEHYQRVGRGPAQRRRIADDGALDKVNEELLRSEHALTDPNGLPGRPWYKHQLYAPGFLHGVQREDDSRRARGHRAKPVGLGSAIDRQRL